MGLHTILFDPSHPERIFIAISAAGVFRTDDHWYLHNFVNLL
jgi:hypothetical protein